MSSDQDFRRALLYAVKAGKTTKQIADALESAENTVDWWVYEGKLLPSAEYRPGLLQKLDKLMGVGLD